MERHEFIAAIQQTPTSTEAAKFLKINRYQLWKLSNDFGVPLKKNQGGKGTSKIKSPSISLFEIFEGKHPNFQTKNLKYRLFKEGIKEKKCEECEITEWNGKPLAFELHHVNGNSKDHSRENLQILCPNCHSQTNTFAGKNVKRNAMKRNQQ